MLKFMSCLCFTMICLLSIETHAAGSSIRQEISQKINKVNSKFKAIQTRIKQDIKNIAQHDKARLISTIKQYEGLFGDLKKDIDEMQVMGAQMTSMNASMGSMSTDMGGMTGSMDHMRDSMDRMTNAMERMEVYMQSIPKMADYMAVMSYAISNTLGRAGNMMPWP